MKNLLKEDKKLMSHYHKNFHKIIRRKASEDEKAIGGYVKEGKALRKKRVKP